MKEVFLLIKNQFIWEIVYKEKLFSIFQHYLGNNYLIVKKGKVLLLWPKNEPLNFSRFKENIDDLIVIDCKCVKLGGNWEMSIFLNCKGRKQVRFIVFEEQFSTFITLKSFSHKIR